MRTRLILLVALAAWNPASAQETDQEVARSVAERAHRAAVGRAGTQVCRLMTVGISEREWVRGVVVEVGPRDIAIRIEDAGRLPHVLNGAPVTTGAIVRDAPTGWTPCP